MIVGILRISIHVAGSRSLKDKRMVVRSLVARIASQFKLSVAEVGALDHWQQAELGVACVSNSSQHADEVLNHVIDYVTAHPGDGIVTDVQTEIIHLDSG